MRRIIHNLKEQYSISTNKNPRGAVLTLILMLNIVLVLGGGLIISALAPDSLKYRGILPSIYYTISMILDPGNMALVVEDIGQASVVCILLCILIIVIGMIIFTGAIIGYVTNYIANYIETANTGLRSLIISGHTVIINWNSRASEIVNDMLFSDDPEKVVILVPYGKEQVEEEIKDRITNTLEREKEELEEEAKARHLSPSYARKYVKRKQTKNRLTVIVREGDVFSTQKLNDISIRQAKSVILLGRSGDSTGCNYRNSEMEKKYERGNSELIKILIQVSEMTGEDKSWDNQKVIVEVEDPWTMYLVNRIIEHKEHQGKCNIVPVSVNQVLGQILAQFTIMPELNQVYEELFSNRGASFYSKVVEEGISDDEYIKQYLNSHSQAIPLTSLYGKTGKHFYFMARDAKSIDADGKKERTESTLSVKLDDDYWLEKRNIIILGHNSKISSIIESLNSFRTEWNFYRPDLIDKYATTEIMDVEIIDTKANLEKANMYDGVPYVRYVVPADLYDKNIIDEEINRYISTHDGKISILVLSDDLDERNEQDSAVMTYLIYLRDIVNHRAETDPLFDLSRIEVIYEIMNPKNYDVIRSYSSKNVIISNRYISKMVGQISEKEEIFEFYNDILKYDDDISNGYESKELYVKRAGDFYSTLPSECTAYELIRATYEASSDINRAIVLGYITDHSSFTLFDGNQMDYKVRLKADDKLIIFSNH